MCKYQEGPNKPLHPHGSKHPEAATYGCFRK